MPPQLIDGFNRKINYLRISVTDRCDFRCVYCMGEKMTFLPRDQLLTTNELVWVSQAFVSLGVTKVRLTGGEPLVRKDLLSLAQHLGQLNGLQELTLTTNGSQLERLAKPLQQAGVKRVNISLDSLQAERFQQISRFGELGKVLRGIEAAAHAGFQRIKLNAVILKHRNHDEVVNLTRFAIAQNMDISFIEEMPLGIATEHNRLETYYSSDQIRHDLAQHFSLIPSTVNTGGPSKYYQISHTNTQVGFISPHSHNFCDDCNRVRITPEGRLILCLGQENAVDLRSVMRTYPGEIEPLQQAIYAAIQRKPKSHTFDLAQQPVILRHMNVTGG